MNTDRSKISLARLTIIASLLVAAPVSIQAQVTGLGEEQTLEFRIGYSRTDNVARTDINTTDSDITYVGLDANLSLERPKFDVSIISDLSLINYSENLVDDRVGGDLDARLTAHLVPDRISWFVADNFSTLRVDPNEGDAPDNLREINIVSTGLNANMLLGARTTLGASVQYGDRDVNDLQDLDSTEVSAGLNLSRQIRPNTNVSLMVNGSNIEYDDDIDTEYDIYSVFLRYQSELASGEVTLDVGASKLDYETASVSSDEEPLFRLSWTRAISERSRILISGSHEVTDLGGAASIGEVSGFSEGGSARFTPTSSPFRASRGEVIVQTDYERTAFQLAVSGVNQQYEDPQEESFDLFAVGFRVLRRLPSDFTISLSGSYGERTSHSTDLKGKDTTAGFALRKSLSRRLATAFTYTYRHRTDSVSGGYTENQYGLDLFLKVFGE